MARIRHMALGTCLYCGETFNREAWRIKSGENKYCSQACYLSTKQHWSKDRFWRNITKKETGCWEWNGIPLQRYGYARLRVLGKQTRAHRHAWILSKGMIPEGKLVLHTCDNRMCVNPDHLFLGTASDNMKDMVRKGRDAGSKRIGEKHPMAKLTKERVEYFRSRWINKRRYGNTKELAKEAGMCSDYFAGVLSGRIKCWA